MLFVRHPSAWLKSFWMYHSRTGWEEYTDAPGFIFYACHRSGEDFPAFVARYLERMPGAVGRMFERYERHADDIGKVETIHADLAQFIGRSHPEIDTSPIAHAPSRNTSSTEQRLTVDYAQGQAEAVYRAERQYMQRWYYE